MLRADDSLDRIDFAVLTLEVGGAERTSSACSSARAARL